MNTEIVRPQNIDGIEFYVSNDGTQTGVSIAGLARLCGVGPGTMHKLLTRLENSPFPEGGPKSLKAFYGKPLTPFPQAAEKSARVIPSNVASAVVQYYAFDSVSSNETAQYSLCKFSAIGMGTWIKELTGHREDGDSKMILSTLEKMFDKITALEVSQEKYFAIKTQTKANFQGIDKMLEDFGTLPQRALLPEDKLTTVEEWLKQFHPEFQYNRSIKARFAHFVSATYKTNTERNPELVLRGNNKIQAYWPAEFPILEMAFRKLLMTL